MNDSFNRQATSWVIAGVIAFFALLGLLVLVAAVVVALEPPSWVPVVAGVALALGTAAFAWLVASALARRSGSGEDSGEIPRFPSR